LPDPQPANALDIRNVEKIFGAGDHAFRALTGVNLQIRNNEFFTLLGPSGCGKTTLLRMIAGFEYPTSGQILLHGEDIIGRPPFQRPVNTVFQNYALFPHMTVAGNIGFGLEMLGKPKAEIAATVAAMLKLVRMEELKDRKTSQISGGQQQRVALARALAPRPKVLLLDEPLSALDLKLRKEMQIELKRLQHETGITFVFVTHDQEEALTMSDRIAVMSKGQVLQVGGPQDIYDRPANHFVANFIGETNFLEGTIAGRQDGLADIALASGAHLLASLPAVAPTTDKVSIVVRPEQARLVSASESGAIAGTVENIVYFGTDTHFHLKLDDGPPFIVRRQNRRDGGDALAVGSRAGIVIPQGLAQVLGD